MLQESYGTKTGEYKRRIFKAFNTSLCVSCARMVSYVRNQFELVNTQVQKRCTARLYFRHLENRKLWGEKMY